MASQDASEQNIAAVCALGFERELAMQALEETVSGAWIREKRNLIECPYELKGGDVKKAVATLLAWEAEEDEESEEEESEESEDESEEEEEDETDEGSTASSLAALQERYGIGTEEEQMAKDVVPEGSESGKYILKAVMGHDNNGSWAVLKRNGMWIARNGLIERSSEGARLEGVRLEFWERL